MATTEVARTMGQGLTRLESYLPSTRGATLFGEARRMLDHAPEAQRRAQRMLDGASAAGAVAGGALAQRFNENNRTFWQRTFGASARRRAEEAELVELAAALAGAAGAGLAKAKVHYDDKRRREQVGLLVWQVVNLAALAEGTVNAYNDALRWRVLDALDLTPQVRARLAATPLPQSHQAIAAPELEQGARDAVATYAFHAYANAVGADEAARQVGPLLVRLGMTRSGGDHFARVARDEYNSESAALTHHYRALQLAVAGIGRHLCLPMDVIVEAAARVVRYNPYEAARAENRALLAQFLRASGAIGALASGGSVAPAMSIALSAAQQLFGPGVQPPALQGAFLAVGQEANLPQPAVQSLLAWNA